MTPFELAYTAALPLLPPIIGQVRHELRAQQQASGAVKVLDVGGRNSPYTIGLPARVTISDLPRSSDLQHELNLGMTDDLVDRLQARRSNVDGFVFDDMSHSALPTASFDGVVSVEVLEHVDADAEFVAHVARVLRPGGWFVMTTPNGDYIPVPPDGDHRRHYTRQQLFDLLHASFPLVQVSYAYPTGRWRMAGLRSWSRNDLRQTAGSMTGNLVSHWESRRPAVASRPTRTSTLIALAFSA